MLCIFFSKTSAHEILDKNEPWMYHTQYPLGVYTMKENNENKVFPLLHRIIGQLNGLERMMKEKRDCQEIMNQLMASRAALEKLGILVLQDESSYCFVGKGDAKKRMKNLENITKQLFKVT